MTRTGTITWSVLGIIGSVFLLGCAICVAILGFAFSIDAPHAWKGNVREGLIFELGAVALAIAAILVLRGSIRRLRSRHEASLLERSGPL